MHSGLCNDESHSAEGVATRVNQMRHVLAFQCKFAATVDSAESYGWQYPADYGAF